jgi:hypothetical protein
MHYDCSQLHAVPHPERSNNCARTNEQMAILEEIRNGIVGLNKKEPSSPSNEPRGDSIKNPVPEDNSNDEPLIRFDEEEDNSKLYESREDSSMNAKELEPALATPPVTPINNEPIMRCKDPPPAPLIEPTTDDPIMICKPTPIADVSENTQPPIESGYDIGRHLQTLLEHRQDVIQQLLAMDPNNSTGWLSNFNLSNPTLDFSDLMDPDSSNEATQTNMDMPACEESSPTSPEQSVTTIMQQLDHLMNNPVTTSTAASTNTTEPPATTTSKPATESLSLCILPPPVVRPIPYKWITESTKLQIDNTLIIHDDGTSTCRLCGKSGSHKRLRSHSKQHYLWLFCTCGQKFASREQIRNHHPHCHCPGGPYEVDEASYNAFRQRTQWASISAWGPCQPTPTPAARRTVPPPLPAPINYVIPKKVPALPPAQISPVRPPTPPAHSSTPEPTPATDDRAQLRPIRARLAPLSQGIPRAFQRLRDDLNSYLYTLQDGVQEVRRDQLTYARNTPEYNVQGEELTKLREGISILRRTRTVLVARERTLDGIKQIV